MCLFVWTFGWLIGHIVVIVLAIYCDSYNCGLKTFDLISENPKKQHADRLQYGIYVLIILNRLHAEFFQMKHKNTSTVYTITLHWHWHWHPSSCKTKTHLFYIVNIVGADVLATQGARASATMLLTMLNRNNSVPIRWELKIFHEKCVVHFISIINRLTISSNTGNTMAIVAALLVTSVNRERMKHNTSVSNHGWRPWRPESWVPIQALRPDTCNTRKQWKQKCQHICIHIHQDK